MALTWNVEAFPDRVTKHVEEETGREYWTVDVVTEALVFLTMAIGWGEITDANERDFYARVFAYERMFGAMVKFFDDGTGKRRDRPITPDDVHAHIGLHTNVFPKETDAKWSRRMIASLLSDGVVMWDHERKDVTVH